MIFALPDVKAAADIPAVLSVLVKQMAAGELTPGEAGTVAAVIETQRRTIETVELEERLQKLEAMGPKL